MNRRLPCLQSINLQARGTAATTFFCEIFGMVRGQVVLRQPVERSTTHRRSTLLIPWELVRRLQIFWPIARRFNGSSACAVVRENHEPITALPDKRLAGRPSGHFSGSVLRRTIMNWDIIKGNWKQITGQVKQKWGKLTDDDLTVIAGKRDELAGILQKKYGYGKDQAEKEVDDFTTSLDKP
jgi:uncharacterized protein YjbJ (UPF0337 family)